MWIHILLFLCYCALFLCTKGFFFKSGRYLAEKLPPYLKLNKKQISLFLVVLFAGNIVGMGITAVSYLRKDDELRALKRQQESYTEELYVTNGENREKIQVEVQTEPYTESEKKDLMQYTLDHLEEEILGKNQSLEQVEYPLNLITELEDRGILIQWDTDQPLILDWEGQIGEAVPKDGIWVNLTAELLLDDQRGIFERSVHVFPKKISEQEQFVKNVQEQLDIQNKKTGTYLYLPMYVDGKKVSWSRTDGYQGLMLVGMAILIGVLLVMCEKSRRKQAMEKRQKEMERDYPGILNKMILLMQAGMSSRRAIYKIALDYKKDLEKGQQKRAAYEELLQTYREMEQGISEEEAYRKLANRCDLLCYRTLSTLLIQNLRKGSSYFISALKQECSAAFEERKSRARIRGEEAGTKLLLPMGCMLLIVLVIILVPSMMVLG